MVFPMPELDQSVRPIRNLVADNAPWATEKRETHTVVGRR